MNNKDERPTTLALKRITKPCIGIFMRIVAKNTQTAGVVVNGNKE